MLLVSDGRVAFILPESLPPLPTEFVICRDARDGLVFEIVTAVKSPRDDVNDGPDGPAEVWDD